jgi:Gti1/Pac2 family
MQNSVLSSSPLYPNAQPYFGVVENTVQALRLVHAARLGVVPRVLRRLNNSERRRMIVSGAVFVFGVEESGIKRWTDGLLFSPSRIDGNFLVSPETYSLVRTAQCLSVDCQVYKELNERTIGPRQSDRSEGWIYMSGEGGRDAYPSVHEHGGQYRTKISFAAESDASTGGLKIGGLVKKVGCILMPLSLSDVIVRQLL